MTNQKCERCNKQYNVLEQNLCYFCYKSKFGDIPKSGCYKIEKVKK